MTGSMRFGRLFSPVNGRFDAMDLEVAVSEYRAGATGGRNAV
jgi:hypothetical protein